MPNPFFYGNPVPPDQFLDRRRERRRIISRAANQGQSTAVVGEPRSGKTSLLDYLSAPEMRTTLYGESEERLLFSYLDAQTLGSESNQAQFWEHVLRPLHERAVVPSPDSSLAQAYQTCQENDFGTFTLERLLAQMNVEGWRLVLLLDEFDVLLHHPVLNCAEFFGGLRMLASRSRGALALVIASRRPLTELNKETQQLSRTGSPYFNFLDEITLGPLPNNAIAELLRRAGDLFTTADRRFIAEAAGGHPYLVQVAASVLWEVYTEGEDDPNRRWRQVGQSLYKGAKRTIGDTWRLWSPEMRKAFVAVALAHMNELNQAIRTASGKRTTKPGYRTRLRQLLTTHFDEGELNTFCFDLDVDYDDLPGEGKANKARELVKYLERRGRTHEIVKIGRQVRPDVPWEDTPEQAMALQLEQLLTHDLGPELRLLSKQGFVAEDENIPGGWRVRPQAFLWWLADELVRTVRRETFFDGWLQKQDLDILLTRDEREHWNKAIRAVAGMLDGADMLIESVATGIAS